jgi:hypothetical protein
MPAHKFHVGQIVELASSGQRWAAGGVYEVTKRLPQSETSGEREYRIKSVHEPHERVARESDLSKARA